MKRLRQAILETVAYADIFDFPLTQAEIWRFLIGCTPKLAVFHQALVGLIQTHDLDAQGKYHILPRRRKIISARCQNEKTFPQKMRRARQAAKILSWIPSVWGVGISGALAMHNAPAVDDIDFLVITAPGTLWFTRGWSALILDTLGWRRRPGTKNCQDQICLNMFMDASNLRIAKKEQDLYSAHEVVQLIPLVNKHQIYTQFLWANRWARKWLPQAVVWPKRTRKNWSQVYRKWSWLEQIARKTQLWYMAKRRTQEAISAKVLRFHPVDARTWLLANYQNRLQGLDKTHVSP